MSRNNPPLRPHFSLIRAICGRLITVGVDPKSAHNYGSAEPRQRAVVQRRKRARARTHTHTHAAGHRHFSRRHHETHTAKGMKTAAVARAYTHNGTLSPAADIAEDAAGVARELPPVHLPVLLPAETPPRPRRGSATLLHLAHRTTPALGSPATHLTHPRCPSHS